MRQSPKCEHQEDTEKQGLFTCKLGLYGGMPTIGHCITCIRLGNNSQEYKDKLLATYERSHPSDKPQISGCCDPI